MTASLFSGEMINLATSPIRQADSSRAWSRFLEKIGRDVNATWTKLDQILNEIQDPETGLALLAKRPEGATPEQAHHLLFWQIQFMQWRDWLSGDVLAVGRATASCALSRKPVPFWLSRAINELCMQHMSPHEKAVYINMRKHSIRWEVAELEQRRRRRGDLRNRKKKTRGDTGWEAATVEKLAGTNAECGEETVKKSHQLIQRAGGAQVTLASYKRAVKARDQRRKKRRKKI